jgi:hypothetical protein
MVALGCGGAETSPTEKTQAALGVTPLGGGYSFSCKDEFLTGDDQLNPVWLWATCNKGSNTSDPWVPAAFPLSAYIGNILGTLEFGSGAFNDSCSEWGLLNDHVLGATCSNGKRDVAGPPLDLNSCIANRFGRLVYVC